MQQLYLNTSAKWREWLSQNHDSSDGVWLVFYNRKSGKPSMEYKDALDEALCFGWIDSIIKNLDEEKYIRKFTPRNDKSKWSEINKKRVEVLISENRMTKFGMAKVAEAKKNGMWFKADRPIFKCEMTMEFENALSKNKRAKNFFNSLSKTFQKQFLGWVETAKLPETKKKRIKESIQLLQKGERLGLR